MGSYTPELVAAAGFTGMLDGFTSKPLEMIKLRQQLEVSSKTGMSIREAFKAIVQEGEAGLGCGSALLNLFRGWLPTVLRETLGCMGFFAAYEVTKVNLGNLERKQKAREVMRLQCQAKKNSEMSGHTSRIWGSRCYGGSYVLSLRIPWNLLCADADRHPYTQ